MSWLKKFWRGEARFWQTFWLVFIAMVVATFFYAQYISMKFLGGMTSYAGFIEQQFYFRVVLIPVLVLWLLVLTRTMDRAHWKWSAWVAIFFVIFNLGTAVHNVTYYLYHGKDLQTVGNDFDGGEGV